MHREFLIFFNEEKQVDRTIDLEFPPETGPHAAYTMDFKLHQTRDAILRVMNTPLAQEPGHPPRTLAFRQGM